MSLLKLVFVILAVASTSNASIGPHFDLAPGGVPAPYGPPTFLPHPVLPPPIYPYPELHAAPTAPLWPSPVLPAPAPLWPSSILPAPAPVWSTPVLPAPTAPVWPGPSPFPYFPAPAPLAAAPLPPVFDPIPFAPPTYRAIPGPITKTHHFSLGYAHPVQVQAAKVIAAPHIHPVKLIDGHSHHHAHIHAHSAPQISLPHHHNQW